MIDPESPAWLDDFLEASFDFVASLRPLTWLDAALRGPVTPPK